MRSTAESVRRYAPFFKKQQVVDVLDYGTGTMRNAVYMARNGFRVYAADLPEQIDKLRSCPVAACARRLLKTDELVQEQLNVDLVLSTYVFNIIMSHEERHRYLETAVANLRPGGYLLIEVRCPNVAAECGSACNDYFACAECAKTLTHGELDALMAPHGLKRICHYYRNHSVAAMYQMGTEKSRQQGSDRRYEPPYYM